MKFVVVFTFCCVCFIAAAPIKVGFVYIDYPTDGGWTYQHDYGRQVVENYYGISVVKTNYSGGWVHEDQSTPAFESFASSGYNLVVATSYGLGQAASTVAQSHPSVKFLHIFGSSFGSTSGNWLNARPSIYQAIFLSGFVAGATSAGPFCFLASLRYNEVFQAVDSFTLGIQKAKGSTSITVETIFLGSWFDTDLETSASKYLLQRGCQVIGLYTDTPLPLRLFSAAGRLGIGCKSDMSLVIDSGTGNSTRDPNVLVSAMYVWQTLYNKVVLSILNNTWTSNWEITGGISDDLVGLSSLSPLVPMKASTQVEALSKKIRDGLTDAFTGPIYDVAGNLQVASGTTLSQAETLEVSYFVRGVVDLGDFEIISCNPGSYILNASCTLCPIGTYTPTTGYYECIVCPAGNKSLSPGSSSCTACIPGTYKPSIGYGDCIECSAGSASTNEGSSKCDLCSPGSYSSEDGSESCSLCEIGTYSNVSGGINCVSCPEHSTTAATGATSIKFCRCKVGYTESPSASSETLICVTGKSGTEVLSIGLGVAGGIIGANLLGLGMIIFFIFHKTEA